MQQGEPSLLIAEEMIDLIKDVNQLNQYALSAQEMLEDKEKAYSLVWFLFNTRTLKSHIISLAFSLDGQERPLQYFQRIGDQLQIESHITIHDLGTIFETFKQKINRIEQAYSKYSEVNRLPRVFFVVANQQLQLMEWNLDQAKHTYEYTYEQPYEQP